MQFLLCTVLYAPYVCELGLDMARKMTRGEIWLKEKSQPLSLMDYRTVWYPEAAGYAVCTIRDGMTMYMHSCFAQ